MCEIISLGIFMKCSTLRSRKLTVLCRNFPPGIFFRSIWLNVHSVVINNNNIRTLDSRDQLPPLILHRTAGKLETVHQSARTYTRSYLLNIYDTLQLHAVSKPESYVTLRVYVEFKYQIY